MPDPAVTDCVCSKILDAIYDVALITTNKANPAISDDIDDGVYIITEAFIYDAIAAPYNAVLHATNNVAFDDTLSESMLR